MAGNSFTNLIVTYNSAAEVSKLLADLRQHAPGIPTTIIDNDSMDATADVVAAGFPEVQLVRNTRNVGYARAVNQGFELSGSEYVFLLNPDIRIDSPGVFHDLEACLNSQPEVAVAAPLQFKQRGLKRQLNFTWSYWTPRAFGLYLSYLLFGRASTAQPIRVSFLNAGCLFIRRSAFEAVGMLNEKYFLYGEEPDLFLKLMRHGLTCRLLTGTSVIHDRERSLTTVPSLRRFRFRLHGAINIADAVIFGVGRILLDRLSGRKPG